MGFGEGKPKVQVTPPPTERETVEDVKKRKRIEERSLIRGMQKQGQLGAEQLKGNGTGLNLHGY
jgi:hypothetical protein